MSLPPDLTGKKAVKDLKIVLKDIEPYVRAVRPLWNGRDFTNFSLRAREIWSLWLVCATYQRMGTDVTFAEDFKTDGILIDRKTGDRVYVENVAAMSFPNTSLAKNEDRVLNAIEDKIARGPEYAAGKVLVVFYDGAGRVKFNKVAKAVQGRHNFERIYLVGLVGDKKGTEYTYSVSVLNEKNTNTAVITIDPTFSSWVIVGINDYLAQNPQS